MKKILVLLLALSSASTFASTKDFGIYGGFNAAKITNAPGTSGMAGLVLGAHVFLPLSPEFEFVPSLQFAQRGFGVNDFSGTDDLQFRTTYLEVLPLLRVKVPVSGMDPYFTAGPNLGLKLGSSCSVTGGHNCTVTDSSAINSLNLGLEFGIGSDFVLSNTNEIGVEIRAQLGLTNYIDSALADGKHRGIAFLFHFNF